MLIKHFPVRVLPVQSLPMEYKGTSVKYFVVDAFTNAAFKGNPAAVCLLEEEKDEKWLQWVAAEINTPATCYLTRINDKVSCKPRFGIRWFTCVTEVLLCGHATLAASHILFTKGFVDSSIVEFVTKSGTLTAEKVPQIEKTQDVSTIQEGEAKESSGSFLIELNFPAVMTTKFNSLDVSMISKALAVAGHFIIDIRTTTDDLLVVLPSGTDVMEIKPRFDEILKCPGRAVIVSGMAPPESGFDFYSRVFSPKLGINEDLVTGSVHCALATYWSEKLGKCDFMAYQASSRSGVLNIHLDKQNQRVLLRGKAVTVMEGSLLV